MSPNLRIAFRFLTAKKRAMLMSLSCTILGVGLFIVTQATTTGFEKFFIKTIIGTDGAVRIEDRVQNTLGFISVGNGSDFNVRQKEGRKYIEGIDEPKIVAEALKSFPNVSGISIVLRGSVIVRSSFKDDTAQVFGIVLADHLKVSDLATQVVAGSLDEFRAAPQSGAVMGRELADRLQLSVGDSFLIEAHNGEKSQVHRYYISAIYQTGVSAVDKVRIYLNLSETRSLLQKPTGASFIQLNLNNRDRAPQDSSQIQEVLSYAAKSWQEREKSWLSAFSALRISSAITVSVFTLIAGLAMFNTLSLIVLEKTKDIAILRSMGYERTDITQIFLWQAGIVLLIGTVLGSIFGFVATFAVSKMPLELTGIFATKHYLVEISGWHYVEAALTAVATVMIASLIPARRAARLEPGDIVRGTAQ